MMKTDISMYKNLKKVKDNNLFQEKYENESLLNTNLTKNSHNTTICRLHIDYIVCYHA